MPETSTRATGHVDVAGASLHYEVRGAGPLLALHAAPMTSDDFAPLADLLAADHTVLTGDPRGIRRSAVADPTADVSPDQRAGDLAAIIEHVDAGPAHVLGSSGGAVSALALAQRRPDLVRTVVAHEPPLAELLPDRDELLAAHHDMTARYLSGDRRGYWELFLRTANLDLPPELFEAWFGGPIEGQDARDERFSVEHMDIPTTFWSPDLAALRAVGPRVVVGIGEASAGQLCDRASRALAGELGLTPALFPGGHTGFAENPPAFAARLREVLKGAAAELT